MAEKADLSGLRCLQLLLAQFRRDVNFAALLTEEIREAYRQSPYDTLFRLAEEQKLRPEKGSEIRTALATYSGPVLAKLSNEKWILILDSRSIFSSEKTVIFDPAVGDGDPPKMIQVPSSQLLERLSEPFILFRNRTQIDPSKQTKLFAFSAMAGHHNTPVDVREVMHRYAVGEEEVRDALFREIVSDYRFKMKRVALSWENLPGSSSVFPMIAVKKNGKYAVFCGMRKLDDGNLQAVVLDPESPRHATPERFDFPAREEFEAVFSGHFVLLKKIYKLSDESQPFSLRWFIPEFIKNRTVFGEIALMVAILTIFSLIIPLFFQIVVDKVLTNQAYNTLNVIGIGVLLAIVFNALINYVRSYLLLFATNKIDISTAMKTFAHLMRLPVDFFERVPSGVLLKHMQQTEKIRGFLSGNLFFTILDLFALCVFVPFLLFYSVRLTLIVLGFSALMALVIASLIKPFQRRLDELYQAEGKRQSMLVESIHGIRTVKSLALEPVEKKAWDDSSAYAIQSYFRVGKISMTAQSISQMLEMMMTVCVIWVGAHLVFSHAISVGALIAFQMLAGRVTGPLVKMVGLIHEYQQIALSVRMLGVVMNTSPEPAGGGVRNPFKGAIEFEDVSFQYRPDLPQVIRDFSLQLPPGTTLGLVGRSGSGKTTLTKLLIGLYPVSRGLIKLDGIDIREIDKVHLRRNIGVVLQENYFFSGTVRANISLPKQNAALEEVIYAAKLAGADEFIQKLPRGYDTLLEENASNLSGGQKQRLAIARALLTNPPILIFDEATSSLDPESETVIRKNLKAIAQGRTVLIISHRLSIVSSADRILVLDNGALDSDGTHKELLLKRGIYSEFWNQQMRGEE
ncbi:MAG: Toxin RTX-I translocation ATP-binding protein [Lentisphaerae bacterium ADurb.Bin242]|nr:MAG: Toxin RTX-I translocation ATP-binding protein [Lentisphaerae bacterium ADurb.Bin242]